MLFFWKTFALTDLRSQKDHILLQTYLNSKLKMKKDQYFPLEVNFLSDERIADMLFEQGSLLALGVYIYLLQHLRKMDNYSASYKPQSLDRISYMYKIERKLLESIICDYGLFELDEEQLTFHSPYLDRVMQRMDARSRTNSENGKKGGRPKKKTTTSETPMDKGEKANKSQERKEENRKSITTVLKNSSNTDREKAAEEVAPGVEIHPAESVRKRPARSIRPADDEGQRPLQAVRSWETLVDELANCSSYMELVGMHSGLGMLFIKHQKRVIELFKDHIRLYSKESGLLFMSDVKQYFSNFMAAGRATCIKVRDALLAEEKTVGEENGSRFETIVAGQRMYLGHVIPSDAPLRPNGTAVWDDRRHTWGR